MPIMTSSGACVIKAGANVNSQFTGTSADNNWNRLISGAESFINVNCRNNFSDTYSTLSVDVKHLLDTIASNLAAIYAIQYDMSGYTSRSEAEDMINILRDGALFGLGLIRDKKPQDFIDGA